MNRTKITDFLTGKSVWKMYKLYNETQWYSKEKMGEFQLRKLRKLLVHCYRNVPYYEKIINERKIDIYNIESLKILNEFPVLTKETIQKNYNDFIPRNNKEISGVVTKQTGGTTGNILYNRNDANTRSSVWAAYRRYEGWMGHHEGDKMLMLMGGHIKKISFNERIKTEIDKFLNNISAVDIYDTTPESLEKVVSLLMKYNFSHIRSYPQFLYAIAKHIEDKQMRFNVRSISSTAEPVMPEHRRAFKKIFNAETFDQYGCGEIGCIACECDHHKGLHITEERVIVETNEFNELLVTDLDNYTMPFIRYWNADQAIISKEECTCGRKSKMIGRIMGRTCDYIIGLNGEFLHWAYFWHLIFDSNIAKNRNLRKFQIIQSSQKDLQIKLVCEMLSADEKTFILTDIKKRVGDMNIEFSYVENIENTATGKYRPVINDVI